MANQQGRAEQSVEPKVSDARPQLPDYRTTPAMPNSNNDTIYQARRAGLYHCGLSNPFNSPLRYTEKAITAPKGEVT